MGGGAYKGKGRRRGDTNAVVRLPFVSLDRMPRAQGGEDTNGVRGNGGRGMGCEDKSTHDGTRKSIPLVQTSSNSNTLVVMLMLDAVLLENRST